MGCSESRRGKLSPEENAISIGEKSLGYEKNPSRQYDLIFKNHVDENGNISKVRFLESLRFLNLNSTGLEQADSKIGRFYKNFETDEQYNCEELVLLGILLSKSKTSDVVDVFRSHLDVKCVNKVKKEDFDKALTIMIKVACDYCSSLGVGDEAENMLSAQRLESYKQSLLEVQTTAQNKISKDIFGAQDIISKSAFESTFEKNEKLASILTSTGLREYLATLAKSSLGKNIPQ